MCRLVWAFACCTYRVVEISGHGWIYTCRYIQAFLSSQLLYRTGYYWLGMTDIDNPGTYLWVSGDSIKFTYWYNTHTGKITRTYSWVSGDSIKFTYWYNTHTGKITRTYTWFSGDSIKLTYWYNTHTGEITRTYTTAEYPIIISYWCKTQTGEIIRVLHFVQ